MNESSLGPAVTFNWLGKILLNCCECLRYNSLKQKKRSDFEVDLLRFRELGVSQLRYISVGTLKIYIIAREAH